MTYSIARVSAAVAMLGLVWLSSSAEAQSQAGGLPDVSSRVQVLETAQKAIQTQVTTLDTQAKALQTQVESLQGQNQALQTRVNALDIQNAALQAALAEEAAARAAAEAKVQQQLIQEAAKRAQEDAKNEAAIAQEVLSRMQAEAQLQQSLTQEAGLRLNGDTNLAAKLDVLNLKGKVAISDRGPRESNSKAIINGIDVPPGNWLVIATVSGIGAFGPEDDDPHAWRVNCELREGSMPGPDNFGGFIGGNFVTGFATNGLTDQHVITITAGLNVPESTMNGVGILCFADVETQPGFWRTAGSRIILQEIAGFF